MSTIMRVSSGDYIDLANFKVRDVNLDDIITSLNQIKRCNGHFNRNEPLTVLEHSMLVGLLADQLSRDAQLPLLALIHDAHEAFIGDNTSPLKSYMGIVEPESIVETTRFSLIGHSLTPKRKWEEVKRYDLMALEIERLVMWDNTPEDDQFWPGTDVVITTQTAMELYTTVKDMQPGNFRLMYKEFLERFHNPFAGGIHG